jgi:AcrR family transcriptional regulator
MDTMSLAEQSQQTGTGRRRRADAVRNRERVIQAAGEVFAEKGMEAGIPEIAALAGVGKATVYRSFPSKEHLVAAVACERLEWITEQVTEALMRDDSGQAFEDIVIAIAERQAEDCSVAGAMAADIHLPELEAARATTHAALEALIDRGRAQGALRHDADGEELRVLFTGVASVLREQHERDPAVWRRYGLLVADAFRAPASP